MASSTNTTAARFSNLLKTGKFSQKSEDTFFASLEESSGSEPLKKITIRIQDVEEMLDPTDRSLERQMARLRAGKPISPIVELSFHSLEQLRQFLTPQRQRVYRAIRRHAPASVYDLAKLLERDYKGVAQDLKVMKAMNLVRFQTEVHNGRARSKPVLTHKRLVIEFG